jgi:hypothetical protein
VSSVRIPPSVHDDGDHGFVPMLIEVGSGQLVLGDEPRGEPRGAGRDHERSVRAGECGADRLDRGSILLAVAGAVGEVVMR